MLITILALVVAAGAVAGTVRALAPGPAITSSTALSPPQPTDCHSLQALGLR